MTISPPDPREIWQIQHQISGFQKECDNITSKHRKGDYKANKKWLQLFSGLWWLCTKFLKCCELSVLALSGQELGEQDMASCHEKWKFCPSKVWTAFTCRETKSPESSHWIASCGCKSRRGIPTYVHCMYCKWNFADIAVFHHVPEREFLLWFSCPWTPFCLGSCLCVHQELSLA